MVLISSKSLGFGLLLASTSANALPCQSRRLPYPEVVDLDDFALRDEPFTLDLEWLDVDPGFNDADGYENGPDAENCGTTSFTTRALGGSVPGPTLTVSPGMTFRIKFNNKLTYQPDSFSSRVVVQETGPEGTVFKTTTETDFARLNKFNDPDVANLHFHGLHVSGILPSDDTTLEVLPQESFEYVINVPEDHEPGLHWVHPHHHGSSTLQLVGGAALALIVKDVEDQVDSSQYSGNVLPPDVAEAPERVHVFQDWDISEALWAARFANDTLLTESYSQIEAGQSVGQRFVTINGKFQPITDIKAGQWERWRFLYAGWQDLPLQFGINNKEENEAECEFYLLAKDGIYLSDYPRGPMMSTESKPLPIPPGGRADFMVRCNKPGATTRFEALGRKNVLTLNCVEDDEIPTSATLERSVGTNPLTPWEYNQDAVPDYLQSVEDETASNGCSCSTQYEGYDDTSRVNGRIYRGGNNYMHTTYLGAVVERSLKGMHEHSYHQHVYPYQIIDFPNQNDDEHPYFKIGDWHDTYLDKEQNGGAVTIRYRATDIPGKIMVHCHNTLHADSGMIQKEYVRDAEYVGCACDIFDSIEGLGIVDDINTPKVIGAVESKASSTTALGVVKLLPVLMLAASMALL